MLVEAYDKAAANKDPKLRKGKKTTTTESTVEEGESTKLHKSEGKNYKYCCYSGWLCVQTILSNPFEEYNRSFGLIFFELFEFVENEIKTWVLGFHLKLYIFYYWWFFSEDMSLNW